jgi:hypothetical protein
MSVKKILFIAYSLLTFLQGTIYCLQLPEVLIRVISSKSANHERIKRDARRNMPSKLRATLTRKDIKDLLRAEEEACLLAIKNEFKISDELWKERRTTINDFKKRNQNIDYKKSNPDKDHSLQPLDPESFKRITEALEAYGINPNAIHILYDEKSNDNASACNYPSLRIHFTPKDNQKIQRKAHSYQQYYKLHGPAHEATHLAEIHGTQQGIILQYLNQDGHENAYIKQQQCWKNWTRTHEKIADLMPLLLPQPIGSLEALLMSGIDACLRKQTPITWNQSHPDATHPDPCAELLPWALSIKDKSDKEA